MSAIQNSHERWARVPKGLGDYEVSSLGRVRNSRTGRVLRVQICAGNDGYARVWLFSEGNRRQCKVHRLVAGAFIPNPNLYPQINHKNSIRSDNSASNLEWCTNLQNSMHAAALGRLGSKGESHPRSKLCEADVRRVVALARSGIGQHEIARRIGVSRSCVSLIAAGVNWKHLNLDLSGLPPAGRHQAA